MKKLLLATAVVLVCAFFAIGATSYPDTAAVAGAPVQAQVQENIDPLETRFLNMLNHNFVYGDDFASFDKIALGSVLSNLSSREGDYIPEVCVKGFANDMYGINIVDFGENENSLHKDGFVHIPAMGYTSFAHKNATVSENEDGTFTVLTDVTVDPHDGKPYKASAVSVFAPNENSSFGYILVFSDISEGAVSF